MQGIPEIRHFQKCLGIVEMPYISVIAKAILGIQFILTCFKFWEKAHHQETNFKNQMRLTLPNLTLMPLIPRASPNFPRGFHPLTPGPNPNKVIGIKRTISRNAKAIEGIHF